MAVNQGGGINQIVLAQPGPNQLIPGINRDMQLGSIIMQSHSRRQNFIHKPVVFGTYAQYRGKKAQDDKCYAWCCYVRGVNKEDISRFVSKVEFEIDVSFPESKITVTSPPFQMHEVGWGQFPIKIKLFFRDESCKPVEAVKDLILFDEMNPTTKRAIIKEDYNELVFVDPSPNMMNLLQRQPSGASSQYNIFGSAQGQERAGAPNQDGQAPNESQEGQQNMEGVELSSAIQNDPPSSQQIKWMENQKVYDQQSIEKGFKDKEFEAKERADIDALTMALAFIKEQVNKKRMDVSLLEKKIVKTRNEIRDTKHSVIAQQEHYSGYDQRLNWGSK